MRETLIDTDILSEIMEGKDAGLIAISRQYYRVFRRYTISAATLVDIRSGLVHQPKYKDLRNFEEIEPLLEVMPIERDDAETAGRIIGELKIRGLAIGHMDPLIAATALNQGMVLATGNIDQYQRIVDVGFPLQIENWRMTDSTLI